MLLLGGAAVSTVGTSLTLLAVAIHVEPAGAGWVAAAMAAELVPMVLLAPWAGRLVDRVRNRELLLATLVVQALAVAVAALVGLRPGAGFVLLGALAVMGAGATVAGPTIAALLPHVTGEAGATRAYGWYSSITSVGFLIGFAAAGLLVEATSVRTALLVDAATFTVLAVAVLALRAQRTPRGHDDISPGSVWLGFTRLRQDRVLLVGVVGTGAAVLATVIVNVAEVFFILDDIGAGPGAYGIVTAFWPAAGILSAWIAGRVLTDRRLFPALAASCVVMGIGLAAAASVVSLVAVGIGWVIGGAAGAVQRVAMNALIRSRTADAERGRVFSAVTAVTQTGNLVGLAAGAGLVGLVGARPSLFLSGALTALAGLVMWLVGRSAVPYSAAS